MPIALHHSTTTITTSLRVNFSPAAAADALGASEMLIKSALSHTQCVCGGGEMRFDTVKVFGGGGGGGVCSRYARGTTRPPPRHHGASPGGKAGRGAREHGQTGPWVTHTPGAGGPQGQHPEQEQQRDRTAGGKEASQQGRRDTHTGRAATHPERGGARGPSATPDQPPRPADLAQGHPRAARGARPHQTGRERRAGGLRLWPVQTWGTRARGKRRATAPRWRGGGPRRARLGERAGRGGREVHWPKKAERGGGCLSGVFSHTIQMIAPAVQSCPAVATADAGRNFEQALCGGGGRASTTTVAVDFKILFFLLFLFVVMQNWLSGVFHTTFAYLLLRWRG
ncbi:hypothetical protein TYRP_007013 [Tyrophagus putrescentiae]|nr:hypothetical protein TYRP_007013 [Tyrophagus putrescentiae]